MEKATVSTGIVQIPLETVWSWICWLPRKLAGTYSLDKDVKAIKVHVAAMSGVLNIAMSKIMDNCTSEQIERVLNLIANYTIVHRGLDNIVPKGNPFTAQEVERLRSYTQQAQSGRIFSPQEATDFRQLSERAAREYSNQDWVADLLKIALFIFAIYAIGKLLKSD